MWQEPYLGPTVRWILRKGTVILPADPCITDVQRAVAELWEDVYELGAGQVGAERVQIISKKDFSYLNSDEAAPKRVLNGKRPLLVAPGLRIEPTLEAMGAMQGSRPLVVELRKFKEDIDTFTGHMLVQYAKRALEEVGVGQQVLNLLTEEWNRAETNKNSDALVAFVSRLPECFFYRNGEFVTPELLQAP